MMKPQRFVESDWDTCIVLDACRFDVFERVYDEYLDGELEKRHSPGSSTPEWAYRTFTDSYDIAYFSANPFINSNPIPLAELKWGASCRYDWTASDHLAAVVDAWDHCWDRSLGTVPPSSLIRLFRENRPRADSHERTVLHFMQPHAPYLHRGRGGKLTPIRNGIKHQGESTDSDSLIARVGNCLRPRIESILDGNSLAMKAGMVLELSAQQVYHDGIRQTAMEYHEQNLRIALESIVDFLPELDGRIVVTADHGEAFGEHSVWEHHIETYIPPLIEVPWLVVE